MNQKIKSFDGIRGLAVISVVLTHMNIWGQLEEKGIIHSSIIPMINGSAGVQAFFILSGFLITTLLIKEHDRTGRISIKNFIIRRTLRILPIYILFLLAATIIHIVLNNATTWDSLIYAYFYAYNFIPLELYTSFLGHTWSLAVEEHFYLIWPLIFLLAFARNRRFIVGLLIFSVLASIVLHYMLLNSAVSEKYFVGRWSFIAGYNISLGCLAAMLLHYNESASFYRKLLGMPHSLVVGIILYANSLYFSTGYWFIDNVASGYIRSLGIVILIVWMFLNQNSMLVKLLEFKPLSYVGVISYGVYLYQGLFLDTGPYRNPGQDWPPDQSIGILLLLFVAPASYHYVEKPFLSIKNTFYSC